MESVFLCVCVRGGGGALYKTFTMECGSCEEVRDTLAVSTLPRLLLLCPSASQDPEDPSRAATATAQTPRLPMSVYLRREVKTQGMDVLYPNTRNSLKVITFPEHNKPEALYIYNYKHVKVILLWLYLFVYLFKS